MDALPPVGGRPAASRAQPEPSGAELQRRKAAEDFTAILMGEVVRDMFRTISLEGEDGPFGSGPEGNVYGGLAETAFGQTLAKNGLDALTDRVDEALRRSQHGGADAAERAVAVDPAQRAALDAARLLEESGR